MKGIGVILLILISIYRCWSWQPGSLTKCQQPGHIALTFDDGPSEFTDGFIDTLNQYGVKATFFIWGERISSSARRNSLLRMIRDGHVIASHTWSHRNLATLTPTEIESEMTKTDMEIFGITGLKPALMRPPYGSVNDVIFNQLKTLGYQVILWNLDTEDWKVSHTNPSLIYEGYKDILGNSTASNARWIALHHDVYAATLQYLPNIINYVREMGYQIVDMKTCLGIENVYQSS